MSSFEETVIVSDEFVRITTIGEYAFEELFGFLSRVKAVAEAEKRAHILIDSRGLRGNMTEAERFAGGKKIAELFGSRFKVALLMPPESITKLGELTAVNRGARFLVSPSESEAVAWLARP